MHLLFLICWRQYVTRAAGPGDSSPSPFHTYHILGSSRHTVLHTSIISLVCSFCNYFRPFSPFFARFLTFFVHWPPAQRRERNPQQEHRNRGRAPARGGNADPRRPVAAAAPRGPPGPERRRRERRGEPRRPGAREPGAERPPGGQPGRSGQRGSASTVEGTAGPGRRDRLPRTPGGPARRRGGRRVGVAARAASGRAARRPTAREKRAGREPTRPAAYRDSRRPRLVRGRGEPLGAPPTRAQRRERGEGPGGGPPAQTPQAAQRCPRAGRRRD